MFQLALMKVKNYIIIVLTLIAFSLVKAQEAILCPSHSSYLIIENAADIPTTSTNPDDTLNLVFAQQYITDIFSNYIIYDFYQTSPNSSSDEVLKYYTISCNSRALVEDILTQVPTNIIGIESANNSYALPMKTTISTELIDALNGKTFDITKYIYTSDFHPCNFDPNCELENVPNDFNFRFQFNYNSETELMTMESESLTSCGNAFSVTLTGGNPNEFGEINNTLQLWEILSATSSTTEISQPCRNIEATIFVLMDIGCPSFNYAYGNISVIYDSETETLRFKRANGVFGYYIIELSEANLSVQDESLNLMKPFQTKGNPYLQLSNRDNQPISIEIYNVSGQLVLTKRQFEAKSIDLTNYTSGLYFIKLSDLNNQQKIFKFLKN